MFWFTAVEAAVDPALFQDLHWRSIGPFRGGRVLAVDGVPGDVLHFYFGAVNGGVWETRDAGRTWSPIFDDAGVGSIGAIAVAPSRPRVIYVGTGEADMRSDIAQGTGLFKSIDAGRHWTQNGLRDSQQIAKILVDPHDPDRVLVAVLGHPYGPNEERGVFRSIDGGHSWTKTLFKDADTGAIDLAFRPGNANIVYAALWQTRRPPWNVYPPSNGPGSGLYKSIDGGTTWHEISGHGLPTQPGRIGLAVAPSEPDRIYALIDADAGGLYRSDNAGSTWVRVNSDKRIWQRGWYFSEITVNPGNANEIYVCNTIMLRSTDGGRHFIPLKGDETGDDFHTLWIDPANSDRRILGTDQGTLITLNGGATWSSWYNQPTGQFYHVVTDNRFPYRVYGAQQDSGAAGVPSRTGSVDGIAMPQFHEITTGGESDNIAPDPDDPDIIYGGRVEKLDLGTEQTRAIDPTLAFPDSYRGTWTLPLIFGKRNHVLYFGNQRVFRTADGGEHWEPISPDLTRENPTVPPNLDASAISDEERIGPRRGVVYSIAPSPRDAGSIWAGTDDGLVWRTADEGAHWQNVTPKVLAPWSKIGAVEPSHFDSSTAYIAVDRHRLDDFRPYIFRTHDGGKSWTPIASGIANGGTLNAVNVVREDTIRAGLLFAGTERGAFVSLDDGNSWQGLQRGLPPTSVRDIEIHGDDLVIATHGRGFYIMDDIEPLRELAQNASPAARLFAPASAYRMRHGGFTGTPMPKDEPMAPNPPDGAYIDFLISAKLKQPLRLAIYDAGGALVRSFTSGQIPKPLDLSTLPIAPEWVPKPPQLGATQGQHRFVWDLHYEKPAGLTHGEQKEEGVWAPPGRYFIELRVDGQRFKQPLDLRPDPRLKVNPDGYQRELLLARQIENARVAVYAALRAAKTAHASLIAKMSTASPPRKAQFAALDARLETIADINPDNTRISVSTSARPPGSLQSLANAFDHLSLAVDGADGAPTADAQKGFQLRAQLLAATLQKWGKLKIQIGSLH